MSYSELFTEFRRELVAFVLGVLLSFVWWLGKRAWRRGRRFFLARAEVKRLTSEIARREAVIQEALVGDGALFRAFADPQPSWSRASIPIIAVGNNKGGVGKTTLAANLGAYFGDMRRERTAPGAAKPVLFVDLDFQGSLSAFPHAGSPEDISSVRVSQVFEAQGRSPTRIRPGLVYGDRLRGSKYLTATFDDSGFEERTFLRWVLERNDGFDPRRALHEYLSSAEVQDEYCAVIIDLPPRAGLYAVAGLVAATHVVAATREDAISVEGVARFAAFLERGRRKGVWPELEFIGVVATQIRANQGHWTPEAAEAMMVAVNAAWRGRSDKRPNGDDASPQQMRSEARYLGGMPHMTAVSEAAGDSFAYFDDRVASAALGKTPHAHLKEIADAVRDRLWSIAQCVYRRHFLCMGRKTKHLTAVIAAVESGASRADLVRSIDTLVRSQEWQQHLELLSPETSAYGVRTESEQHSKRRSKSMRPAVEIDAELERFADEIRFAEPTPAIRNALFGRLAALKLDKSSMVRLAQLITGKRYATKRDAEDGVRKAFDLRVRMNDQADRIYNSTASG